MVKNKTRVKSTVQKRRVARISRSWISTANQHHSIPIRRLILCTGLPSSHARMSTRANVCLTFKGFTGADVIGRGLLSHSFCLVSNSLSASFSARDQSSSSTPKIVGIVPLRRLYPLSEGLSNCAQFCAYGGEKELQFSASDTALPARKLENRDSISISRSEYYIFSFNPDGSPEATMVWVGS